jgi:TolA-binding protein
VSWLAILLLLLVVGGLAALGRWASSTRADSPSRRWARVAQRRAPVGARPVTAVEELVEHIEAQLDVLHTERQRLANVQRKGWKLRHRMLLSAQHRPQVPVLERQLEALEQRAHRLDGLIAKYQQHRDDVVLLREREQFSREVADIEADQAASPLGQVELTTDELDDEAERLLAVAEAEAELDEMLRAS